MLHDMLKINYEMQFVKVNYFKRQYHVLAALMEMEKLQSDTYNYSLFNHLRKSW